MPASVIERPTSHDAVVLHEVLRTSVPEAYRPLVEPPVSRAFDDPDGEERILLARDRPGGAVTGFVLFGIVPGTLGAGRVRAVAIAPLARRRGVGRALLTAAVQALDGRGARFVLVELPDDPPMRFFTALLDACGFVEEARAEDLVRNGVAMRYLRRELGRHA
jgi:ribosomal protein S18 acetylase RimI-like enzyme